MCLKGVFTGQYSSLPGTIALFSLRDRYIAHRQIELNSNVMIDCFPKEKKDC